MANVEERAKFLKHVPLDETNRAVLATIRSQGKEGFQLRKQYEESIAKKEEPQILRLPNEIGCNVQIADAVTLVEDDKPVAVLQVDDKWTGLREQEAETRFGTTDPSSAEAKAVLEGGDIFFGGRVTFLGA